MNEKYMKMAIDEAMKANELDEIPVGCVILKNDKVIACGYNCREKNKNSIDHAEIIAISRACEYLKTWRLDDCIMYVTLEPCMMCMGAIIESRIKNVYYGTKNNIEQMYDIKRVSNKVNLVNINDFRCSKILTDFFKKRRKK